MDLLKFAGVVVACGSAFSVAIKTFTWFYKTARILEKLHGTNTYIIRGLLAALDGLEQLQCNGSVTAAKQELERYLIDH